KALEKASKVRKGEPHSRATRAARQAALKELGQVEDQIEVAEERRDAAREASNAQKEQKKQQKTEAEEAPVTLDLFLDGLRKAGTESQSFQDDLNDLLYKLTDTGVSLTLSQEIV